MKKKTEKIYTENGFGITKVYRQNVNLEIDQWNGFTNVFVFQTYIAVREQLIFS